MGVGGIGIWQLVIILAIVLLLFGTKRLRNLGGDVGGAIKGFKKAMNDDEEKKKELSQESTAEDPAAKNTAEKQKADSN
ncbi:MAG: twin-arginine translocase TatA/TatE family subunit [Pseudomonadales bacterium]|nr:twin-arginine translocase TatA/TatE family subunit [Pseudomonadales bacterium]